MSVNPGSKSEVLVLQKRIAQFAVPVRRDIDTHSTVSVESTELEESTVLVSMSVTAPNAQNSMILQ